MTKKKSLVKRVSKVIKEIINEVGGIMLKLIGLAKVIAELVEIIRTIA